MPKERRRGPRVRVDGARVSCQDAAGERGRGRGVDLGEGGIFVQMDNLPAVGASLSLEVHVPGESRAWAAGGRVVWVRDLASKDGRPRGMGVAFVDIDNAARAAIARVLAPDAATGPGEAVASRTPSRERTVLGVGLAAQPHAVVAAPIVAVTPSRERTVLGVAPVAAPQRQTEAVPDADDLPDWPDEPPDPGKVAAPAVEPSAPIALTAVRARAPSPVAEDAPSGRPEEARDASLSHPAGVPRKGRATRVLVVLLLFGAVCGGAYRERAQLRTSLSPYVGRARAQLPPQWFR
ncbi:MAG: PilZ domain-containing protein [Polyangiaceae bacterium]